MTLTRFQGQSPTSVKESTFPGLSEGTVTLTSAHMSPNTNVSSEAANKICFVFCQTYYFMSQNGVGSRTLSIPSKGGVSMATKGRAGARATLKLVLFLSAC